MAINKNMVSIYDGGGAPASTGAANAPLGTNSVPREELVKPVQAPTDTGASTGSAAPPAVTEPSTAPEVTTPSEPEARAPAVQATMPGVSAEDLNTMWQAGAPDVNQAKADQLALMDRWHATAAQQSNKQIDYSVNQGVTELERALADAQPQFKEQQESVTRDEMQSRDNAALYAEARGDKGGIGEEQYSSIMNTAAQNRLAVQQAQTKLATDTQRQIADLRAQGEFDKADAALEVCQQYLSQLMSLEQWAFDAGMSVEQFKVSLDQWLAKFQTDMAQYQTELNKWAVQFDYGVQQDANNQLASAGEVLLAQGIMPSSSQLAAMRMTTEQAQAYVEAAKLAAGPDDGDSNTKMSLTTAKEMAEAGQFTDEVIATLKAAGYSDAYLEEVYGYDSTGGMPEILPQKITDNWQVTTPSAQTATDGVLSENTVAWARKVVAASGATTDKGKADYLITAMKARNFSDEDINAVLIVLGFA